MTYSLRHLLHQKLTAAGVSALLAVAATPVLATSYGAGIENSQWYLSESVFECSLVHEVPGYGRAVFRHRAGEALSFYLESEIPVMRPGRGQLVVEAPAWRPGVAPRAIGSVTVSDQPRAVTVSSREATLMTQGLLQGMRPTVTRAARYDDRPVRVQLSNVNFSGPYSGYRECVSSLLPVNYDQIRRSRVPFVSGSTSLSDTDRQLLDNIVTYVMADSTVERIFVDGHSDSVGSRIDNRALSEERANVVADYLRSRGIDDDLLIVRGHGDQFPVSRRHADNRRTTIRLQRQGERPELQQANGPGMDFSG
ncbi:MULTISPECIES: flagellar protein MotY [unclassified Marinobacter]|uniref:flagellar protein MotY n=1 Tax=unclassified Marinobacter TaxID=83889 RepID=UPI0012691D8E|nr:MULTISPECIES: OmpA family protein [unclassified Marinobacter]QFS87557.1 Outer membrane protein P5 precursor [Marinobacter sp. THAF197a]QFT51342.1 Outer membrane protein P5 precursor [Marinobacter sp. THAF39]